VWATTLALKCAQCNNTVRRELTRHECALTGPLVQPLDCKQRVTVRHALSGPSVLTGRFQVLAQLDSSAMAQQQSRLRWAVNVPSGGIARKLQHRQSFVRLGPSGQQWVHVLPKIAPHARKDSVAPLATLCLFLAQLASTAL